MRATLIASIAVTLAALAPIAARAEIITLECTGDVTGTFTFDLSGGTGATYDDTRTIDLKNVEISQSTISFSQEDRRDTNGIYQNTGDASQFRIDRATNQIESITYQYLDNKVVGESHATGQCKPAPTPHKPL